MGKLASSSFYFVYFERVLRKIFPTQKVRWKPRLHMNSLRSTDVPNLMMIIIFYARTGSEVNLKTYASSEKDKSSKRDQ